MYTFSSRSSHFIRH